MDLVLAGLHVRGSSSRAEEKELISKHVNLRGTVTTLGHVTSDERAWLLANSEAVIYPSSAEGFGFVPHEAMALGTATLMSGFGPLVDSFDPPALCSDWLEDLYVNALIDRIRNPGTPIKRDGTGNLPIEKFTWDLHAARTVEFFSHVASRPLRYICSIHAPFQGSSVERNARLKSKVKRLRTRIGRLV